MTARLKGFVVTLDQDMREDDVADIVHAIGMVRGVVSCEPMVAEYVDHMARERVREELGQRLHEAMLGVLRAKREPR